MTVDLQKPVRVRVTAAILKPVPKTDDELGMDGFFDPWNDLIVGIDGSYANYDDLFIQALIAIRDRNNADYLRRNPQMGEFVLYVLSGHGFIEYGTSPRTGWPEESIMDVWQLIIDRWQAYRDIAWRNVA